MTKITGYSPCKITCHKTHADSNHKAIKELLVKNLNQHHKREALIDKSLLQGDQGVDSYKLVLDLAKTIDVNRVKGI